MTAQPGQTQIESDMLLLHRFIETGDPALSAEIVQRYARVVYSASLRILGDEGRAQDVSQETFFRLMQRPRLVTHSLAGWLHRTATHLALDVRRGEKSRRSREQSYGLDQQRAKAATPCWTEVSPFVDQALNEIVEPTRGLLIRHFLQGVPQSELAAEMDVSAATLSRRIKTGLEQMQQNLRKKGIYLSLALLAGFFATKTDAAVPAAFVAEMGKMNLVGAVRQMPAAPSIAAPAVASPTKIFVATKVALAFIGMTLAVAVYALYLTSSWWPSGPSSPPTNQDTQPTRVSHDR